MFKLNAGELTALAIIALSCASMLYIFIQARFQRLLEREREIDNAMRAMIFDNRQAIGDGYIFCSVWRLSYIVKRGQRKGYTLTCHDLFKIIADIRNNFDPDVGINTFVIDNAIERYIHTVLRCDDVKQVYLSKVGA